MSAVHKWRQREIDIAITPVTAAVMPLFNDEVAATLAELDAGADLEARVAVRSLMLAEAAGLVEEANWRDNALRLGRCEDIARQIHSLDFACGLAHAIGAAPKTLDKGAFRASLEAGNGRIASGHMLYLLHAFNDTIASLEPEPGGYEEAARALLAVIVAHVREEFDLKTAARAGPWVEVLIHALGFRGQSAADYEKDRNRTQ